MASRWIPRIPMIGAGGGGPPPQIQDHFAPKYLVGNTTNGDSAVPYSVGGFRYIPDPGDGTGIATALAAAGLVGVPGRVRVRAGTYALAARLSVPQNVYLEGEGVELVRITSPVDDHCAVELVNSASISDLSVIDGFLDQGIGNGVIEATQNVDPFHLPPVRIARVYVTAAAAYGVYLIGGAYDLDAVSITGDGADPALYLDGTGGVEASAVIRACIFGPGSQGDLGYGVPPVVIAATHTVNGARIIGCTFDLANGIAPIDLRAASRDCVVTGNYSSGSGGAVPINLGIGNLITSNAWA